MNAVAMRKPYTSFHSCSSVKGGIFTFTDPLTVSIRFGDVDTLVSNRRIMLSHVLPSANVGWLVKFLKKDNGNGESITLEKSVLMLAAPASELFALKDVVLASLEGVDR